MIKLKNLFPLLISLCLLISCQDDIYINDNQEKEKEKEEDNRELITFSSMLEYYDTLNELKELNLSELKSWSRSRMDKSYFDLSYFPDSTLTYLPYEVRATLNSDLEFKVNDSILWYNHHLIYYLTDQDCSRKELDRLKSDPTKLSWILNFGVGDQDQNPKSRILSKESYTKEIGELKMTLNSNQSSMMRATEPNYRGGRDIKFAAVFGLHCNYEWVKVPGSRHNWSQIIEGLVDIKMYELINGVYQEVKDPEIRFMITNKSSYFYDYTIDYISEIRLMLSGKFFPSHNEYKISHSKNFYDYDNHLPGRVMYGKPVPIFKTKTLGLAYAPRHLFKPDWEEPSDDQGWVKNACFFFINNITVDLDDTEITIQNIGTFPMQGVKFSYHMYDATFLNK